MRPKEDKKGMKKAGGEVDMYCTCLFYPQEYLQLGSADTIYPYFFILTIFVADFL